MARWIEFLLSLGLGLQTGTILFFSFVLTPVLFSHLPREEAGRAVRLAFPGYYLTLCVALALALLASLFSRESWLLVLLIAAGLGVQLYAGLGVLPRLSRLRQSAPDPGALEATDPLHLEWKQLHGLSVKLNLGALVLGLAALWVCAG